MPGAEWYEEALDLYKKLNLTQKMTWCITCLGELMLLRSDYDSVYRSLTAILEDPQGATHPRDRASIIKNLGDWARERRDLELARRYYQDALALYTQLDDDLGRANCVQGFADIELSSQQGCGTRPLR